uniref:PilZ domain-containing protein n=1 Tax=Stappia sp. TaxID=1870903 RepID=UPI003BAC2D88
MAQATALTYKTPAATKSFDRRRHSRVKVNILGRFMREDRLEYPCQVVDMSPGGAAMIAPVAARIGERIIAYIDHIGRVEGQVVREIEGGFAISINAPLRKRDKLANVLTWLANRDVLNLPEDRRHDRFTPKNPLTQIVLPDGRQYQCRIIDLSLSGASLRTDVKPEIGVSIDIGKMRARVVRHTEEGIAVEFANVQNRDLLEHHIS